MNMLDQAEAMKLRTKQFAIRIVSVVRSLLRTREGDVIGKQLLRSGTAVAANYRAVCRSRSKAEFISKINVVVEEARNRFLARAAGRHGSCAGREVVTSG
jgi:hypothetical protein